MDEQNQMPQGVNPQPMQGAYMPPAVSSSHRLSKIISAVIVLLIIVAGIFWWLGGSKQLKAQIVSVAPVGQLVAGFDQRFILSANAEIVRSHNAIVVSENGSSNMFVTIYTVPSSVNGLFKAYLDYMRKSGYEITRNVVNGDLGSISGTKTLGSLTEGMTVSIKSVDATKREVIVTVSTKM